MENIYDQKRYASTALICATTRCSRCISRNNLAGVLGGIGGPSGAQCFELFRRITQFGIEVADPKPAQITLHRVDQPSALLHERLALAARALDRVDRA